MLVDSTRLYQVIMNLLDNALKYTPAGGTVTLFLHTSDHEVRFGVADTGIGIASEDLPKIFRRFYRTDEARTGPHEDTDRSLGLGLATLLHRKAWTEEQRESGLAALGMGMIGITEGAIPFAAADPLRVIPTIMFGSMIAATIAMLGGVGDHAPHGGPIVLPVVDHRLVYVLAIASGALVTAITINLVKKFTEHPAALAEGKK